MDILTAITQRRATRAFLPEPVDDASVRRILETARWAPSGVNTQPWQVAVLRDETRARLTQALLAARAEGREPTPDYAYYPARWEEPFRSRRRECGLRLYQALGVAKDDPQAREIAWRNNYSFFGAPRALLFFLPRGVATGSWLDMGMFLQNVMLAALAEGLATCPQASIADYPDIVRELLGLEDDLMLVCGMALGHADPEAAVNQYRLPRAALEDFCRWYP